ncbi:MAG: PEP-CTERM sorting domain-containing protein [Phycisphaerae bacterium]
MRSWVLLARLGTLLAAVVCCVVTPEARGYLIGIHDDTGTLYSISTADAAATPVGNTGIGRVGSLEFSPSDGLLYGFTHGVHAVLYSFDPVTAAATTIGPLNLGTEVFEGGLAFSPDGTVYGVNGGAAADALLFRLDTGTGQATVVGALTGGRHDIGGLAWRGGLEDGTLVALDRVTASLLLIDPFTGGTTLLAELSEDIQAGVISGMALADAGPRRSSAVGYFSTAAATGTNALYSFDPYTGQHALIGEFDPNVIGGAGLGGLAFIPEPASSLLLAAGTLALLYRRRR